MGQDDVKISDLWDFFFGVCVFHTKSLPLGKLHWIGFQAFGAEDLEDLEGQYRPNLIRFLSQLLGNFCSNLGTIIPQTWGQ